MENNTTENVISKSKYFYIALVLLVLSLVLSFNTDLAQFTLHEKNGIPVQFFWIIFSVDALILFSLLLIYFYKKVGAILFPILVFLHFMLHNFYLSTSLMADLNVLFVYFAAGLLVIVPRWKDFR